MWIRSSLKLSEIRRLLNKFCTSWENECIWSLTETMHWQVWILFQSNPLISMFLWPEGVWGEWMEQKKAGCAWGTNKCFGWDVLVRRWKWVHCYAQQEGIPQRASCLTSTELSPGGKSSTCSSAVDAINTDCKLRNLSEDPHQKGKQMLPAIPIQITVPGWATVY